VKRSVSLSPSTLTLIEPPRGMGRLYKAGYAVFFGYYLPRKERVEPARLRTILRQPVK
jgi:hypothetical protein